jgi:hypothetical protein
MFAAKRRAMPGGIIARAVGLIIGYEFSGEGRHE